MYRNFPLSARTAIDDGFEKGAAGIRISAHQRVPVRTGRLKSSIRVRRISMMRYRIEATAPYAGFVEYGTRFMNAKPYLRPAYRAEVRKLSRWLKKNFGDLLRRMKQGAK